MNMNVKIGNNFITPQSYGNQEVTSEPQRHTGPPPDGPQRRRNTNSSTAPRMQPPSYPPQGYMNGPQVQQFPPPLGQQQPRRYTHSMPPPAQQPQAYQQPARQSLVQPPPMQQPSVQQSAVQEPPVEQQQTAQPKQPSGFKKELREWRGLFKAVGQGIKEGMKESWAEKKESWKSDSGHKTNFPGSS